MKSLDPIYAESKVVAKPLKRDVIKKGKQPKVSFRATDNEERLAELRDYGQYVKTREEKMGEEERDECAQEQMYQAERNSNPDLNETRERQRAKQRGELILKNKQTRHNEKK